MQFALCRPGVIATATGPSPTSIGRPGFGCLREKSGVTSRAGIVLVYPRVDVIEIPAALDLGGT